MRIFTNIRAPPIADFDEKQNLKSEVNMKKIFYILDPNGEFYSTDRTKRYKALSGQALYQYLQREEGRGKYFEVWKDDDRDVTVGVEVPVEMLATHRKEVHRREYVARVMRELDISHTSLEIIQDLESEAISGEQIIPSLSMSVEDEIMKRMEREELLAAVAKLERSEMEIIQGLFYEGKTERNLAQKYGLSQVAIHKRKQRILEKLKNILEKN